VMEGGRIVERGTHGELMAMDGRYTQMWNLQQADAKKAVEREAEPR
jgi:ABC-type multidrug transport system fused ATPase/permease subunit